MRPDMSDVMVERPRRGMRNATRHAPWEKNASIDDLPAREGVRKRHTGAGTRRELNENLAPLRRFLVSQAGRPWNVVYSEICANIRPRTAVQLHVLQHVWDFVERDVVMADDGAVCSGPGRRYVAMYPLRVGALYIPPGERALAASASSAWDAAAGGVR